MSFLRALGFILNIGKKIVLVSGVFILVIGLFVYFINQDKPKISSDPIKKNREIIYSALNNPKLNSTKRGKTTVAFFKTMLCGVMGEACTNNPNDADKFYQKSLIGSVSKLIVLPYINPPASAIYWAYSGLQNAGFVPKTYAAEGIGFAALRPFSNIWKVSRDVAYMILVLILIIAGFMIMFRMKLNPQTVISVEGALPRLVITLLLITFSFAIAGFLIDLMYTIITLSISVLSNHGSFFDNTTFQNKYLNPGFADLTGNIFPNGPGSLFALSNAMMNILPDIINQAARLILGFVGVYIATHLLYGPISNIVDDISSLGDPIPVATTVLGGIEIILKAIIWIVIAFFGFGFGYASLPIVLFLLIAFTIVFLLFRIFFLLFSTYIKIVFYIIFAPIFLLFEAIPGKAAFSFWFKNLFAEILTFPLVVILLIVSFVIVSTTANTGTLWRPPFLNDLNPNALTVLIGMWFVFMIPDFTKMVKEMLGAKGMPVSPSLGVFFGGVGAAWGGAQAGMGMYGSLMQAPLIGYRIQKALAERKWGPQTEAQVFEEYFGPAGKASVNVRPCLPVNTLIDSPKGSKPIQEFKSGDLVWTSDRYGKALPAFVIKIIKTKVAKNHKMISLTLADERQLLVSLGHPTSEYYDIAKLALGDRYDGSYVIKRKIFNYRQKYTYDILPSGPTGTYWANNILIGSTLVKRLKKQEVKPKNKVVEMIKKSLIVAFPM